MFQTVSLVMTLPSPHTNSGSCFSRGLGTPLRVTPCKAPFAEPGLSDAFQRVRAVRWYRACTALCVGITH